MLQERGGGTLTTDGYGGAFNAIASEETDILMASIVNYAEQSARTSAEVSKLRAQLEAMTMNQQPRVQNFANNAVYQPPMGHPMGYGSQRLLHVTESDYGSRPTSRPLWLAPAMLIYVV